jgi:hypothetical protein
MQNEYKLKVFKCSEIPYPRRMHSARKSSILKDLVIISAPDWVKDLFPKFWKVKKRNESLNWFN